ncbi:OmpL47-type beta-barrel domain-containing protein [Paenibacillus sedimenti]|uniref:Family 43 glycosylhydrolase n=1 Tax=Paenibacillus sedimenti TaxID=2770274 RepID=A0A926KU41_9BACL|nr:family 43 glycosylhydrolase [Paenibacillus sedimenti]MBD0384227.1 family 43 glycosylhydrolase [Paenibacillus sedimenti]
MHKPMKVVSLLMLSLFVLSSVFMPQKAAYAAETSGQAGTTLIPFTEQQLKDNDYILYFVNAGDPTPRTVESTDKMGLFASVTEQVYGLDPVTGKAWGLATGTSGTNVSNAADKYGSLRYYNGTQVRNKALTYNFELPEGDYDVTFGFKNPWSGRSVNLIMEGTNVSNGDYDIGSYGAEKEVVYKKFHTSDGQLNVSIQGPSSGTLTNYNDPLVNYIIVRLHVTIPITDLQAQIAAAKVEAGKTIYTKYSIETLKQAIVQAEALAASVTQGGVDITAVQDEVRASINQLKQAIADLAIYVPYSSYEPGISWKDTNGAPIQAHGGGILHDERTGKYYWYGEDKTFGYLPTRGVRVYSSSDLYNWQDEGLALTAIETMDQFDTDPLISQLYAGRTDKADIFNDIGTQRIIERPKVIYNDKTHKYVMWMHTDGPSATSNANYAKAEAGYALSDSPTGPFVYQVSNRMDRVPPGATYDGQPNQPGMARDMNLFKDDDGTAYLIYSSEENMTIYISKLNDSYTDIVGWHKDGQITRDTTYKAEYGKDYIRVFPGAQREAPAMFKYAGKYYLITSGATGWAPNKALYTVADQIFGEWKPMRDLSVGTKASTTFDSQSTYVIPVDPAKGKFIYMGDRWNSSNLKDSRYIWLPLEFGQNDEITLKWYDQWNLELLNRMGRVTVDTVLPTKVTVGQLPDMPGIIHVTTGDGTSLNTPVVWSVNASDFAKPGTVTVGGTLPEFGGKAIQAKISVIPEHVIYFVHAGGAATSDYVTWSSYMQETLLNPNTIDQQYDPTKGQTWGYVGNSTNASGNATGNLFTSLRYLKGNSGNDLTYAFDLNKGRYTVYVGLHDPWYQWSKGNRIADIRINGETKRSGYVFTDAYDVLGYSNVEVTNGKLELTVHRSASAPATNSDPQISWIMIIDDAAPVTTAALNPEQPGGLNGWYTSDVTLTLTGADEGAGIANSEYRVNGGAWQPYTNPVLLSDEGSLTVDYRSTDLAGNTEDFKSLAILIDKTAPQLQLSVDKQVIGPPNHKMVPIHVAVNTDDAASGIAAFELVSITSDEPDNVKGDGNTEQDIQDAEYGTSDTDFSLRAERSGIGSGRVYTITYKVTDHAGLETISSVQVKVDK